MIWQNSKHFAYNHHQEMANKIPRNEVDPSWKLQPLTPSASSLLFFIPTYVLFVITLRFKF